MHVAIEKYRNHLLQILPGEATFSRREFPGRGTKIRQRLDGIGQIFMLGCHAALEADTLDALVFHLNGVEAEFRGFAFEGAGMGLTIFDHLTHWKMERLQSFLVGPGAAHMYTVYVGVGWALARLRRPVEELLARLDPVLGWLAVDGYGFHEGFFWRRYTQEQVLPERLSGYALQAFDQGLGRSIWFIYAADVDQISATISAFAPARQSDLWSGVGLACAYAGAVERTILERLRLQAGSFASHVAQGIAIAAKIRQHAGNPATHTELACQVFCGSSAESIAHITDLARENLSSTEAEPAYEIWRQRIRLRFA